MSDSLFVIDSRPVLEWLQGKQPVASRFSAFLEARAHTGGRLWITRINFDEIVYMLPRKFSEQPLLKAELVVNHLRFEKASIDDALVDAATQLTRDDACSYADCFAAALSIRLNAPVVTGDREFQQLRDAGLIALEWLGA